MKNMWPFEEEKTETVGGSQGWKKYSEVIVSKNSSRH